MTKHFLTFPESTRNGTRFTRRVSFKPRNDGRVTVCDWLEYVNHKGELTADGCDRNITSVADARAHYAQCVREFGAKPSDERHAYAV